MTPVALKSVSKSIFISVLRKELTMLEIAVSLFIVTEREVLFPALSVAVRINVLFPHARLILFDQLDGEMSGTEFSVAFAMPPRSKILPVISAAEPVTCALLR